MSISDFQGMREATTSLVTGSTMVISLVLFESFDRINLQRTKVLEIRTTAALGNGLLMFFDYIARERKR